MYRMLTFGRDFPKLTGFILLSVTLFAISRLPHLEFDFTLDRLLMKNDPQAKFYDDAVATFGSDNITTIYIKDERIFEAGKLKILKDLIPELEKLEKVNRVESLFNSPSFSSIDGILSTSPLFGTIPETSEGIETYVLKARENPLFNGKLIAKDANVLTLQVHAIAGDHDAQFNQHLSESIEEKLESIRPHFQEVFQLGTPVIYDTIASEIMGDQKVLLPLVFVTIACFMFYFMRTISGAVIPLAAGVISLLWVLGFMTLVDVPVHLLISMLPLMMFVIGSMEDTHMMSEYVEGLEQEGSRHKAITFLAKKSANVILITSMTTIIGFASITLNEIIMLKDFGLVLSVGLALNNIVTILFIPWYLSIFGEHESPFKNDKEEGEKFSAKLFRKLADLIFHFTLRHRRVLIIAAVVIVGSGGYFARDIVADNGALSNFKKGSEIRQNAEELNQHFPGITNFYVVLTAPGERPFRKHEGLKKLFEISQSIENSSAWGGSRSFAEMLALVNQEMTGAGKSEYRIPENDDLIAQYMLFFTRQDMESFVSADYSKANIVVNHQIESSYKYIDELELLKADLERMLAGTGITFELTAKSILNARAGETIVTSQIESLVTTILMIAALLAILFGNVKIALFALLPNVMPLFGFFGFMGFFGIPLSIGTSVIADIVIGIAVDDTIHFFYKFNKCLKDFPVKEDALRETLRIEVRPMVTTALSLSFGLSLAAISSFVPIVAMGTLMALSIGFGLVSDLLVTPQILMTCKFRGFVTILDLWSCKVPSSFWRLRDSLGLIALDEAKRMLLGVKIIENKKDERMVLPRGPLFVLEGSVFLERQGGRSGDTGQALAVREYSDGALIIEDIGPEATLVAAKHSRVIPLDKNYFVRLRQILPERGEKMEQHFLRFLETGAKS